MQVELNIENLDHAENTAKQILQHIEEIKKLTKEQSWYAPDVTVRIVSKEAVSGN